MLGFIYYFRLPVNYPQWTKSDTSLELWEIERGGIFTLPTPQAEEDTTCILKASDEEAVGKMVLAIDRSPLRTHYL